MGEVTILISDGRRDLRRCREVAQREARNMGFRGDDLGDIVTAVFEACVNAFTYGRAGADDPGSLTINTYADRFEAVVKDSGPGFACPDDTPIPPSTSPRGRGIPLMRSFMDEVRFGYENGCKVTLVKRLPAKREREK